MPTGRPNVIYVLSDEHRGQAMSHSQPTEHVLILFHGYTNCPEQFARLGERFHELGYNVLIPRLPYHGYADRMTGDIAKLAAEDLAAYGDEAATWPVAWAAASR